MSIAMLLFLALSLLGEVGKPGQLVLAKKMETYGTYFVAFKTQISYYNKVKGKPKGACFAK